MSEVAREVWCADSTQNSHNTTITAITTSTLLLQR